MRVYNMTSASGKAVANQFNIETKNARYFQSYGTLIAKISDGKVYLDEKNWDCSQTTGKYRNQFLGLNKKEIEEGIKAGEILLVDLSKEEI